ncbi:hypothetical protein [Kitasatospora sp. NPDC001095]
MRGSMWLRWSGHDGIRTLHHGAGLARGWVEKDVDGLDGWVALVESRIVRSARQGLAVPEPVVHAEVWEAGTSASVGSVADSYDNAMAEALNGTFKAELIDIKVLGGTSTRSNGPSSGGSRVAGGGRPYRRPPPVVSHTAAAGTNSLTDRRAAFNEFKARTGQDGEECGILCNARLLSEGIRLSVR